MGFVVLGSDSKIVGANGEVGGKIEYCVTTMIGVSSSDEFVGFGIHQSHVSMGRGSDGIGEILKGGRRRGYDIHIGSLTKPRHKRGVAKQFIDFPIIIST